jgi:pimeloyl-ACP methyl ester carboxylesterase
LRCFSTIFDELGISLATVVGHSLGGGVAMQFVYQHPDYIQRLILISSGGLGLDVGLVLLASGARGPFGIADHCAQAVLAASAKPLTC